MSDDQKSYYEIGDRQYPRVTNIIGIVEKSGLARWRGRVGNTEADRISKEATDFGKGFHEVVAQINHGMHTQRGWFPPDRYREMAYNYIQWMNDNIESIEGVEELVWSEIDGYAGTLDLRAKIRHDKLSSIVDVKTSKYVSIDWPLQLSAYRKAKKERGIETQRRMILRVNKEPPYAVDMYDYKDHEEDEVIFNHTLEIWKWLQRDKERHKDALVIGGL